MRESCAKLLGVALDLLDFIRSRRAEFTKFDLASELGISARHAHRYLLALEARGLVVPLEPIVNRGSLTKWKSVEHTE